MYTHEQVLKIMYKTLEFVLDQVYAQGFECGVSWSIEKFDEIINHAVKE